MLRSGSIGKLMGQDALGNKYYEAYEGIASPVQTGAPRSIRATYRPDDGNEREVEEADFRRSLRLRSSSVGGVC